jgi:hypothetical protein
LIVVVTVALFGGALYLRRVLPWPFKHEGKKYRRMRDGTFQDAQKNTVQDMALIAKLTPAYEAAKYGASELQAWDADNS